MIKVVYFIAGGTFSGSNIALLNFVLTLKNNNEVEPFVIMNKKGDICDVLDANNIGYFITKYTYAIYPKVKNWKHIISFSLKFLYAQYLNIKATPKIIKQVSNFKPDIIHTNVSPLQIGYNIARKLSMNHIWHVREYMDLYYHYTPIPSFYYFKKKMQRDFNRTIFITKDLQKHYGVNVNSVVLEDGVKSDSYKPIEVDKGNYFVFVGRLEEGKGIIDVLLAFNKFASMTKQFKLLILGLGEDAYVSRLKSIVKNNNRIEFLGFVDKVDRYVSGAKALIMASKHEGLGFTTIEAMYNKTLVLGRNSGGTKSILKDGKYGVLFNTKQELFHAMLNVYYNKVNINLDDACDYVRRKYSIERNAKQILNIYKANG